MTHYVVKYGSQKDSRIRPYFGIYADRGEALDVWDALYTRDECDAKGRPMGASIEVVENKVLLGEAE